VYTKAVAVKTLVVLYQPIPGLNIVILGKAHRGSARFFFARGEAKEKKKISPLNHYQNEMGV
jgi:hypothetical protein